MNQIKYSAYALLLVFALATVGHLINRFSSIPLYSSRESSGTAKTTISTKAVKYIEGKNLFQSACQSCHAINKTVTGPALAGVEKRGPWSDRKTLIKWVKNSALIVNDYAYTKELFQQYNRQPMPSFQHLSGKEIESIFDYIKEVE